MQNLFLVAQNLLGRKISRFSASFFLAATLAALAGCGSGQAIPTVPVANPLDTTQTITGTVATGAPVAGAMVTVQDHNGKTNSGTTADNGTFSISVTGGTPPFMLAAVPLSGSNLYSILSSMDMTATNTQNVNVTTITTLVVYELYGHKDPASMYNGFLTTNPDDWSSSAIISAETLVRSQLPANSINPIFSTMYDKFTADGGGKDPYDSALDDLGAITSITDVAVTLTNAANVVTTYPKP